MNLATFNCELTQIAKNLSTTLGYKSYRQFMQAYPDYSTALYKLKYNHNNACSSYTLYRIAHLLNIQFVITKEHIDIIMLDADEARLPEPINRRLFSLYCMDVAYELKDRGVATLDEEYYSLRAGCLRTPIMALAYNTPHSFFATSMCTIVELVPSAKLIIDPQGIHLELSEELYPKKEVVVSTETKTCYHCGEIKNISMFLRGKHHNECRACYSKLNKKWQKPDTRKRCAERNHKKNKLDRDTKKAKLGFSPNKNMRALEVVQKINSLKGI